MGRLVKAVTVISGSVIASGANTIATSPGVGAQICLSTVVLQNYVAASQLALLKSGSSSTKLNVLCKDQGDGVALAFTEGREIRLDPNDALVLDISTGSPFGYTIGYFVES
ncbi:MAG: hypothetical protein WCY09_08685 [Candidatus Omnitrophota bacterium]